MCCLKRKTAGQEFLSQGPITSVFSRTISLQGQPAVLLSEVWPPRWKWKAEGGAGSQPWLGHRKTFESEVGGALDLKENKLYGKYRKRGANLYEGQK